MQENEPEVRIRPEQDGEDEVLPDFSRGKVPLDGRRNRVARLPRPISSAVMSAVPARPAESAAIFAESRVRGKAPR